MSFFVRKINRAKWQQNDILNGATVSADAVTSCMKTAQNKLSVWHIDDATQVNEAVLAIASKHEHLETIDVVLVSKDKVFAQGLSVESTPGDTPVKALVDNHYDVINLDYSSLGIFANCIVESFRTNMVIRISRKDLKVILEDAIRLNRLKSNELSQKLVAKLEV